VPLAFAVRKAELSKPRRDALARMVRSNTNGEVPFSLLTVKAGGSSGARRVSDVSFIDSHLC